MRAWGLILFIICLVPFVYSQTVGIDGGSTYSSISNAIAAAVSGDHILMSTGIFYETVFVSSNELSFRGGYDENLIDWDGGETVIDGQGGGTTFWIADSSTRVEHVTITKGVALAGGGVLLHRSAGEFVDVQIVSNFASWGGGMFVGVFATATVHGMSMIYTNTSLFDGGGITVDGRLNIQDGGVEIKGNVSGMGGGVFARSGSRVGMLNTIISENTASSNLVEDACGGGLYATNADVNLQRCSFINNRADYQGGGCAVRNSTLTMTNTLPYYSVSNEWPQLIADNYAGDSGGALLLVDSSAFFKHMAVIANRSDVGPGIHVVAAEVELQHVLVANNRSPGYDVVGFYVNSTGICSFCTIVDDGTSSYGVGGGESDLYMYYSIVYGHSFYNISTSFMYNVVVAYSDVGGGFTGTGNIDADPLLMSNYHLSEGSPCIDAGTPAVGTEVDIDGEPLTGIFDFGFDEFVDTDGDRMPDIVETGSGIYISQIDMGTDPLDPDSDGDSFNDGDEWYATTDPLNGDSFLGIIAISNRPGETTPWITFKSGTNAHIWVEWSDSPTNQVWNWSLHLLPPTYATNELGLGMENQYNVRVRAHR